MLLPSLHQTLLITISILRLASAADTKPQEPCTAHSSGTGANFDLRPLQLIPIDYSKPLKSQSPGATNESYHARGYDYPHNFTLNFCGPVVDAMNLTDVDGVSKKQYANISAYYKDKHSGEIFSLGFASDAPVFRGRKLILNYTHGSPCPDLDGDGEPIDDRRRSPKIYDEYGDYSEDDGVTDSRASRKAVPRRKSTLLSFVCDTTPSLSNRPVISFLGTTDHCTYAFEVRSRWACATAAPTKVSGTLGPGGVFAVILTIAILVYVAGGIVYQRNVMHQRGWRQLPNYNVWAGIFGFFSDIFVILFSSCSRCIPGIDRLFGGKRGGYHRVGDDYRANGSAGRGRTPEDENRLIDQLDEEWD